MITLPCLGGTNWALTAQHGQTRYAAFAQDEHGQTVTPPSVEHYLLDTHPLLGSYWRHASLTTPEAIAAAYEVSIAARRKRDEGRALSLFSGAAAERAFRLRMDPMNLATAVRLLPVLRGETRSNQWRQMDRSGWAYALRHLNGWPQRDSHNRLKRADTVAVDGVKLEAWFDWRASQADEHGSQLDHAVLITYISEGEAYWWGNEHAVLDLLEPVG